MPEVNNRDPFQEFKKEVERNSKDHTSEFDPQDIKMNCALAAACYVSILFFLPLLLRPDSKYARFHANQGLVFLIATAVLGIIQKAIPHVPFASGLIGVAFGLIELGFFLYGFVNTLNGKAKELPFIGGITLIK